MTTTPSTKQCKVCHADVSNAKRVKDQHGNYYCQACHDAAARKKGVAGVVAAPVGVKGTGSQGQQQVVKDEYDFSEPVPQVKARVAPPVVVEKAAAAEKEKPLPAYCPNCDTKMLPGRRLCMKCNRDVTRMDKLLAIKAEAAKGPSKEEKIANVVAGVTKVGLILVAVGAVLFSLYGIYILFKPESVWKDYPLTRKEAVQQYMEAIAKGTQKGDDRAYHLTSLRILQRSNNDTDVNFYMASFRKVREEFTKKYGADWITKVKVERLGDDDMSMDDEVAYAIKIDGDSYMIGTQVQIALQEMVGNMGSRHKQTYSEDGKNHFGITEIDEFPIHPRPSIKEGPPPPRTDNFGGGFGG